ncbi:MAG: type I methionyl aminopeptidase [Planctomycetaceae bacterium]|nr:type I methionyl aminopeptidase [Planctomycetaceae bacterium]
MLSYKSAIEIDKMRKAGLYVWHSLQIAKHLVRPGITTGEINNRIEKFFEDMKVIPLFKGVPGKVPFPAAACISVNEEIVHGIPGSRKLAEGDIVGVDIGCKVGGWCGDSAVTFPVGRISDKKQHLLNVTKQTLQIAIEEIPKAVYWNEVAKKMEAYVKQNGYSVVESLVGHGIGQEMHENPQVPNYVSQEILRSGDFKLVPGLVIAVEPMVNVGTKHVRLLKDHWTIVTADHKPSAHFEHTLAITVSGVRVLTGQPETEEEKIDIAPYLMT